MSKRQMRELIDFGYLETGESFDLKKDIDHSSLDLRSKEKIALTKGIAVYCRAIDETLGEMRIHYAGFAHPLFGRSRDDDKVGKPLIFEVRAHNVKVNLRDGEKLAHLIFYRMSEDVLEEKESLVGAEKSGYEDQDLKLSGYFGKWPEKLKRDEKYLVQEAEEE